MQREEKVIPIILIVMMLCLILGILVMTPAGPGVGDYPGSATVDTGY